MHTTLSWLLVLDDFGVGLRRSGKAASTTRTSISVLTVVLLLSSWCILYANLDRSDTWKGLVASIAVDALVTVLGLIVCCSRALTIAAFGGSSGAAPALVTGGGAAAAAAASASASSTARISTARTSTARSSTGSAATSATAAAVDTKDAAASEEQGGHGGSARTPLLQAGAGSSPAHALYTGRAVDSLPLTTTARAQTTVGRRPFTLLGILAVVTVVASCACDFATANWETVSIPVSPLFVLGDVSEDFFYCVAFVYVAVCAWVLRHRCTLLARAIEGGGSSGSGVDDAVRAHPAARDPLAAMQSYLDLRETAEQVSAAWGVSPIVMVMLAVVELASVVQEAFEEHSEAIGVASGICLTRLYAVVGVLVATMVLACSQVAATADEVCVAAAKRYIDTSADGPSHDAANAQRWMDLAGFVKRHPLELRFGSIEVSSELANGVVFALFTLGFAIVGIRLPEM